MSTSLFLDKVLSVYLSEGMMVFTAVLLIAAIIAFIKGKGRRALRAGCVVVGIYCILYLGAILVLSSLFASNHEPTPSTLVYPSSVAYAEVLEKDNEYVRELALDRV